MSTSARTVILHVTNEGIHVNPLHCIPWARTNFPDKRHFDFSESRSHDWRVRQDAYDPGTGLLTVTVLDLHVVDPEPVFSRQMPKSPVQRIHIQGLAWPDLQAQLSMYRKDAFTEFLSKETNPPTSPSVPGATGVMKRTVPIDSRVSLSKVRFKLGFVEMEIRLNGIPDPVRIQVSNPHILPEFDIIKPFFAKMLGKRTLQITGSAEVVGRLVRSTSCTSADLDRINDHTISTVRRLVLRDSIRSKPSLSPDKELFSSDEFFADTPAQALGNTYREQERLLLEEIIEAQSVRNGAQLRYLAGQLQEADSPLKFTLHPHFGFVFHHAGETMHHFLWELLNTHATYLWSLPKGPFSASAGYRLLEREINAIRDQGRMTYLHQIDRSAFVFHRIPHEHSCSAFIDGFPIWRARLTEKLI